jgi:hypothetical protein
MPLEIHAVIYFLWLKNLPNPEMFHEIDSVYGASVIGLSAIQKWTHCFEEGEQSLEDEFRFDFLCSTEHIDAIRALLTIDPHLS